MTLFAPRPDPWVDPLAALRRIQDEVNRAFGDVGLMPTREFPLINVWRSEEGGVVAAQVPGANIDDIEITVDQNVLTIKGKREPEATGPEVTFHRQERFYGPFARTIVLPFNVDADKVRARAQNGILIIELPRPEAEKPKKIQIKAS